MEVRCPFHNKCRLRRAYAAHGGNAYVLTKWLLLIQPHSTCWVNTPGWCRCGRRCGRGWVQHGAECLSYHLIGWVAIGVAPIARAAGKRFFGSKFAVHINDSVLGNGLLGYLAQQLGQDGIYDRGIHSERKRLE